MLRRNNFNLTPTPRIKPQKVLRDYFFSRRKISSANSPLNNERHFHQTRSFLQSMGKGRKGSIGFLILIAWEIVNHIFPSRPGFTCCSECREISRQKWMKRLLKWEEKGRGNITRKDSLPVSVSLHSLFRRQFPWMGFHYCFSLDFKLFFLLCPTKNVFINRKQLKNAFEL